MKPFEENFISILFLLLCTKSGTGIGSSYVRDSFVRQISSWTQKATKNIFTLIKGEDSVQRWKPRTNGKRMSEVWDRKRIADGYQTDGKGRAEGQILLFFLLTIRSLSVYDPLKKRFWKSWCIYRMFRNRYIKLSHWIKREVILKDMMMI